MEAKQRLRDAEIEAIHEAADLEARFGRLEPEEIIALSIEQHFAGVVAAVSSFGADSAVLLKMIADVDPALPVLFLDTGKHFGETLDYRDALAADLGLTNLRIVHPLDDALAGQDPDGILHKSDTDACCEIRKVEPMARGATVPGLVHRQETLPVGNPCRDALLRGGWRAHPRQSAGAVGYGRSRPLHAVQRSSRQSARRLRLSVDRLLSLHRTRQARRGCAREPLGRPGEDRMWHPPFRPRRLPDFFLPVTP